MTLNTDSLYIKLKEGPGADTDELVDGFIVDFDAEGNVIGFDIEQASKKVDLKILEMMGVSIPIVATEQKIAP